MNTVLTSLITKVRRGAASGLCLLSVSALLCALLGQDLRVIRVDSTSGSQYRLELGRVCTSSNPAEAKAAPGGSSQGKTAKPANRQTLVQAGCGHFLEAKSYKFSPVISPVAYVPAVPVLEDGFAAVCAPRLHFLPPGADSPPPPSRAPPLV